MARTMTSSSSTLYAAPRDMPGLRSFRGGAMRIADTLFMWHERARQRRFLAMANTEMLRDIGVGRAEIEAETGKPFWRD
jgi:uncharacterized protein YjiS (DUF1127 family)